MVRGDWVLFHPVYQPDELKAVEVFLIQSSITLILMVSIRFCIARQRLFQINSLTGLLDLREPYLTLSLDTSMSKALQILK